MEKEHTIRESVFLVVAMAVIIIIFTIVGYWDSISERREKDREAYYEQTDALIKKQQRETDMYRTIGNTGSVNDGINNKTKLSDLDKEGTHNPTKLNK
ncbi:MAG: hypothetical protein JXR56_08515 [Candidatus Cloacimonetes bacterium]|nr:hypothetical protein [Candidatus Cloacimonadota bacterium]